MGGRLTCLPIMLVTFFLLYYFFSLFCLCFVTWLEAPKRFPSKLWHMYMLTILESTTMLSRDAINVKLPRHAVSDFKIFDYL